jgi:tetratricopeptide (TPR) repeat protein
MKHIFSTCLALCLLLLISGACSQKTAEEGADDGAAELQEIMAIRDQAEEAYATAMAELTAPAEEPVEGEPVEGEPAEEMTPEQIALEMDRIKMDREGQYVVYTDKLVTYINNHEESVEAKAAYADYLAKFVAAAHITEMGNYKKAVEVFNDALALDPGNAEITALRDQASALRFMTQERFDTVTKKMTYEEVMAICGVANPKHIIEEIKRGKSLVGWFYPTVNKSAVGIYFQEGLVYKTKFDAIKAPVVRKLGETEEAAE